MADLTQYNNGTPLDGTGIDQTKSFGPLPAGEYGVRIVDACVKQTNAGNGFYIKLEMETETKRRVWWNLTLSNPSEKATQIGKEQLDSVRQAVGLVALSDTNELIGKLITVKLSVDGEYNKVNYCKTYEGQAPAAMTPPAPVTPPAWPGAAPARPLQSAPAIDEIPF